MQTFSLFKPLFIPHQLILLSQLLRPLEVAFQLKVNMGRITPGSYFSGGQPLSIQSDSGCKDRSFSDSIKEVVKPLNQLDDGTKHLKAPFKQVKRDWIKKELHKKQESTHFITCITKGLWCEIRR